MEQKIRAKKGGAFYKDTALRMIYATVTSALSFDEFLSVRIPTMYTASMIPPIAVRMYIPVLLSFSRTGKYEHTIP